MRKTGAFGEIKTGLEQAIAYERGTLTARKTVIYVAPIEKFTSGEIKAIREKTGLSRLLFAKFMGVSVRTVAAWESGRSHPKGMACRLLALTRNDSTFPKSSGIIIA